MTLISSRWNLYDEFSWMNTFIRFISLPWIVHLCLRIWVTEWHLWGVPVCPCQTAYGVPTCWNRKFCSILCQLYCRTVFGSVTALTWNPIWSHYSSVIFFSLRIPEAHPLLSPPFVPSSSRFLCAELREPYFSIFPSSNFFLTLITNFPSTENICRIMRPSLISCHPYNLILYSCWAVLSPATNDGSHSSPLSFGRFVCISVNIVTCEWLLTGFGLLIGFIEHLQIVTTRNYSVIANSHIMQFTTAYI
jgi:hypothetical protein